MKKGSDRRSELSVTATTTLFGIGQCDAREGVSADPPARDGWTSTGRDLLVCRRVLQRDPLALVDWISIAARVCFRIKNAGHGAIQRYIDVTRSGSRSNAANPLSKTVSASSLARDDDGCYARHKENYGPLSVSTDWGSFQTIYSKSTAKVQNYQIYCYFLCSGIFQKFSKIIKINYINKRTSLSLC